MSENAETYETEGKRIKELVDMLVPIITSAMEPWKPKPLPPLPLPPIPPYTPFLAYCPHLRDVRLEVIPPAGEGDVPWREWHTRCDVTGCSCDLLSNCNLTFLPYRECVSFLLNLAMQAQQGAKRGEDA